MAQYYVNRNAQENGDHEVHVAGCSWLPNERNRVSLGNHPTCRSAVREARRHFPQANGCAFCSPECHTS